MILKFESKKLKKNERNLKKIDLSMLKKFINMQKSNNKKQLKSLNKIKNKKKRKSKLYYKLIMKPNDENEKFGNQRKKKEKNDNDHQKKNKNTESMQHYK